MVVAGSADPQRTDNEPRVDVDRTRKAAAQIGATLARAGCRILSYSSAPEFIETHVVRGFASAKPMVPRAIQVRFPTGSASANFPEHLAYPDLFEFQADLHAE